MGLKKILSQLMDPESAFPDGAGTPPPGPGGASSSVAVPPTGPEGRALAGVLRAVGEGAFEMEGETAEAIRERFDALARQVETRDEAALGRIPGQVQEHRRRERLFVGRNVRELAETLVGFVTRLGRNASLDRGADAQVRGQLERLRGAVRQESLESVRREVMAAVETIGSVLADREDRQKRELQSVSQELRRLKDELTHTRRELALDGLTRICNRSAFDEHLEGVHALAVLADRPATLLMADIDLFKRVNDTWGHPAGDAVLKSVADALVRAFPRRADFVARYGGEEFAVVLSEDGLEVAGKLCERLLERIRALEIPWEGEILRVTLSVGVAELDPLETPAAWVARADRALYQAKNAGRDRFAAATGD